MAGVFDLACHAVRKNPVVAGAYIVDFEGEEPRGCIVDKSEEGRPSIVDYMAAVLLSDSGLRGFRSVIERAGVANGMSYFYKRYVADNIMISPFTEVFVGRFGKTLMVIVREPPPRKDVEAEEVSEGG